MSGEGGQLLAGGRVPPPHRATVLGLAGPADAIPQAPATMVYVDVK